MTDDSKKTNEPLDPRVYFASERTLLSWIRTGLAMMGFGFVVARFGLFLRELQPIATTSQTSFSGSVEIGAGMVVLGVVINLLAAIGHIRLIRRFKRGEHYQPSLFSLAIAVTVAL